MKQIVRNDQQVKLSQFLIHIIRLRQRFKRYFNFFCSKFYHDTGQIYKSVFVLTLVRYKNPILNIKAQFQQPSEKLSSFSLCVLT